MKKSLSLFFLILINFIFCQQNEYFIDAIIDPDKRIIKIDQEIIFFNNSNHGINHLILNDWPHSYSTSSSPLGKRLSEDFTLNFQRSTKNQRGSTKIIQLNQGAFQNKYERIEGQIDLIKVFLKEKLNPNEKAVINIKYEIKIPINDFTGYGIDKDQSIRMSEWFLSLSKFNNSIWIKQSNLDLDDISIDPAYYTFRISFPKDFNLISNISIDKKNIFSKKLVFTSKKELKIHNPIFLTRNNKFKEFDINNKIILTDLDTGQKKSDSVVNKIMNYVNRKIGNKSLSNIKQEDSINFDSILNKTFNYVQNKLGDYSLKKLIISEFNLKRNPIYGFNNIPDVFNPFEIKFIKELNILKQIINQYLKNLIPFNQRKDFWEVKGIETFLLMDYINTYYSDVNLIGKYSKLSFLKNREYSKFKFSEQFRLFDNIISSRNINQPIKTPLDSLTRVNYKIINPYKSGLSFKMLNDYLGDNQVLKTIKEFSNINKLNSKDYKSLLEQLDVKYQIGWFNKFLKYDRNIDFSIKKISDSQIENKFLISNNSDLNIPIKISLDQQNIKNTFWIKLNKRDTIIKTKNQTTIKINPEKYFSENSFSNNISSTFKNKKKIKFVLFNDFEDNLTTKINYIPLFNYNLYDGIMPGISFSNSSVIKKAFNYKVVPYLSTKQNELLGKVNLKYTSYNKNKNTDLFSIDYFLGASTFHYKDDLSYNTFFPSILMSFRDKDLRSNSRKYLSLRYMSVFREENINAKEYPNYNILNLKYVLSNSSVEKAFNFKTDFQYNRDFIKTSLTLNYRNYYKNNRQFNVRLFVGKFLKNRTKDDYFSFSTYRARDYLFSANLLGRSENSGFYSQQYIGSEGGFKSRINTDYANDYIFSINSGITIWQWIEAYGGSALIKNNNKKLVFDYESGIRLNILTDYFELYLPVYSSLGNELSQSDYLSKIRFRVSFDPRTLSGLISRRWF